MRSNVLAGINDYFNYELQRFGTAFIQQNSDALILLMTHGVWKRAKTSITDPAAITRWLL